jgi:hypothetical protein
VSRKDTTDEMPVYESLSKRRQNEQPVQELTISILVEKAKGLLKLGNLFFGKLVSHFCCRGERETQRSDGRCQSKCYTPKIHALSRLGRPLIKSNLIDNVNARERHRQLRTKRGFRKSIQWKVDAMLRGVRVSPCESSGFCPPAAATPTRSEQCDTGRGHTRAIA